MTDLHSDLADHTQLRDEGTKNKTRLDRDPFVG